MLLCLSFVDLSELVFCSRGTVALKEVTIFVPGILNATHACSECFL